MSKYIDFGYGEMLNRRITSDGKLLALLITIDDPGDEPEDLWERFVELVAAISTVDTASHA